MSDAFLVLAQAPGGIACFLLPRCTPEGARHRFVLPRFTDKRGHRSHPPTQVDPVRASAQPGCADGYGVRAVLRYIKKFAPKELVVTGGSGAGESDEIFRIVGLMDVVKDEKATFFDHNRPPFKEVRLDYGKDKEVSGPQRSVMINPRVLEYETLVALNQLKVHSTATVTMALKNTPCPFQRRITTAIRAAT